MINIPTYLTLFRIILIPVLITVYYLPIKERYVLAAIIFSIACITDWLDGYLARVLKQVSSFGEFLDPIADKLVVVIAMILIISDKHLPYLTVPAIIIIGREISMAALREWMAMFGKRASLAVTLIAKIKTAVQMLALILLFLYIPGGNDKVGIVAYILVYIAAFLTLYTMIVYLKIAFHSMKNKA